MRIRAFLFCITIVMAKSFLIFASWFLAHLLTIPMVAAEEVVFVTDGAAGTAAAHPDESEPSATDDSGAATAGQGAEKKGGVPAKPSADSPSYLPADRAIEDLTIGELKRLGASKSRFAKAQVVDAIEDKGSITDPAKNHALRLAEYPSVIEPLLRKHCAECHSDGAAEGNFKIDTLDPDLVNGGDTDWWIELFSVVTKGEMPPADAEPLNDADRTRLVQWLSDELQIASAIKRKTQEFSGFRRLTKYEYNYALQDLLGVPWDFAKDLPPEAQSEDGFVNRSDLLHLSVTQFEMYYRIAREALGRVIVHGEQPQSRHWLITADQLADREWKKQDDEYNKLSEEFKDQPDELKQGREKLLEKFSKRPRGAHYQNLKTGRFAPAQWQYYNAKYAFSPADGPLDPPDSQDAVAVLPNGDQHKLIFELGNQLPDRGIMKVTAEVAALDVSDDSYPSLQLLFGWQASNEGRALLVVGDEDVPVTGTIENPQLLEWEIPLGEIYPRNSVRKTSPMGVTPSPSEYIRFVNTSVSNSKVQIHYVAVSSPVYEQWPPSPHEKIFKSQISGAGEISQVREEQRARDVLERFMNRAWRGSVTKEDVEQKIKRFRLVRDRCESFEEAIAEVLAMVLSSPRFLYVSTKPPSTSQKTSPEKKIGFDDNHEASTEVTEVDPIRTLSDLAIAERLSLFLWCTIPDDELLRLARDGKLTDADVLSGQVHRMIQDPRSKRFVEQFVRQWLNLELLEFQNLQGKIPGFDPRLQQAMLKEPVEFIAELLHHDESLLEILHADFAVVNERLAKHYGIEGVRGNHFRRVPLTDSAQRGGLITQAGFLAMNSDYPDSHPLKRSVWLLERVLNDPPPPPPPAVPQIDLADPRIAKMTLKERIEDHRNQPACASCHIKIDPWGIAFENYDALGRWRDSIDGKPVDSTSELFNGESLSGIRGLKRFLIANRQDQLVQSVVEKILAYSLGRSLSFSDQSEVEKVVRRVRFNDDGFQQCILSIVTSELFLQW